MVTYVLVPGAASAPWHWHLLEAELVARGHNVVVVDLPNDQDGAGLERYADAVVTAVGDRTDLVLVAHSMAGLSVPHVCQQVSVGLVVLLNAMVPAVGESAGEWWDGTGYAEARQRQDERDGRAPDDDDFFDDLPAELAVEARARLRAQSSTPFEERLQAPAWPEVPTRCLLSRQDRFFPVDFQRRVLAERLGLVGEEMDGGHFVALSRPVQLADLLEGFADQRA